ncbi:MAG: hypothetical protein EPO09_20775 [Aquabacterium sp.]|uniref:phage tail assembly chaperone n=1 Tax=Aquabacterium sp. TaxID=1872578 RepID=UPI0012258914|nr:phage tail assembly chaperone [Aquabacterium sp.]TAK84511.1 MAG: hypothetical protein EPO09_20775 [Aquabacterium sp.]
MAKITLGKKPETFVPFPVKFKLPTGEEGVVNVTYKYRDREEFGAFQNSMLNLGDAVSAIKDGKLDHALMYKQVGAGNAQYLMGCVVAWDLDFPVSVETFEQLARELPAAVIAMSQAYGLACTEGRLGN